MKVCPKRSNQSIYFRELTVLAQRIFRHLEFLEFRFQVPELLDLSSKGVVLFCLLLPRPLILLLFRFMLSFVFFNSGSLGALRASTLFFTLLLFSSLPQSYHFYLKTLNCYHLHMLFFDQNSH